MAIEIHLRGLLRIDTRQERGCPITCYQLLPRSVTSTQSPAGICRAVSSRTISGCASTCKSRGSGVPVPKHALEYQAISIGPGHILSSGPQSWFSYNAYNIWVNSGHGAIPPHSATCLHPRHRPDRRLVVSQQRHGAAQVPRSAQSSQQTPTRNHHATLSCNVQCDVNGVWGCQGSHGFPGPSFHVTTKTCSYCIVCMLGRIDS